MAKGPRSRPPADLRSSVAPHYQLKVLKDLVAVARAAAEVFVTLAAQAEREGRPFRVALAGGSTPRALYEVLTLPEFRNRVNWDNVIFFFGDERAVSPDHLESNYRAANEALFRSLKLTDKMVHRMRAECADLEIAAESYENQLRVVFGGKLPQFDLVFLGMGPDGHTASLFPGDPALQERARWVVPVMNAPKLPARRLTLTVPVLNAAHQVVFMVAGSDKAAVLPEVLRGSGDPQLHPAKLIRPGADHLLWLVDEAAGSALDRGGDA